MRKVLILLLFPVFAYSEVFYVSPSGSDVSGMGTYASPYLTLNKCFSQSSFGAGDTLYMLSGTYTYYSTQRLSKSGGSGAYINIWAYPGATVTITKGSPFSYSIMGSGVGAAMIYLRDVNYIYLKNIRITGFRQENTELWRAILAYSVDNCKFEQLDISYSGLGMAISHNSSGNYVINSDFYHNRDSLSPIPYNSADGLQFNDIDSAGWQGTNYVTGCRAWRNGDDGFDGFRSNGKIVYTNCWSFYNGYRADGVTAAGDGNGFKLGELNQTDTVKRELYNCVGFQNRMRNIYLNTTSTRTGCAVKLYNCTSYDSQNGRGVDFYNPYFAAPHVFVNVIHYSDYNKPIMTTATTVTTCTFLQSGNLNTAFSVSDADFESVTATGVTGVRKADGSLPDITFLHLVSGSDLVNRGTNVGLPYAGACPDLGAFEYGLVVTTGTYKTVKHFGRVVKDDGRWIKY